MSSTVSLLTLTLLTLTSLTSAAFVLDSVAARSAVCPVMFPTSTSTDNRIVNGDSGDPFVRSHLISFHREGCGGALLSKRWGITAGHCNVHDGSSPTIAGSTSSNGIALPLKKVHTHPDYAFPKNDIVLLEFAEDAPDDVNFIYVNDNDAIPEVKEYARVAGWGHTNEDDNPNTKNLLFQIDLPVVSTESCAKALDPLSTELNGQINNKMHICAGYDRGECDSCKADSGGPLFLYGEDGELVMVAVVSFGVGCAREGVPGGYSRTSTYVDWMKSVGAIFETRSSRKPVFFSDASGDEAPADSGTPSEPETPPNPAPAAPSPEEVPPTTAPTAPSSGPEQPAGTTAPTTTNSPPSGEGTATNPQPQPSDSGSGTAPPPTTAVGPASPPTGEPDTNGSDSSGDDIDSPDTSSSGGQGPSSVGPAPVSGGADGETGPEASPEGDPIATAGPEVSGNSGAAFAGGSDGGGVNIGVVVGSCVGVLALVAVICVVVVLRRRAAARSQAVGTTTASDANATDATVTDAAAAEV